MQIRCPNCRDTLNYGEEETLIDVPCPKCGSHFNLLSADDQVASERIGRNIGHFQLIMQVGAGAFGSVWKAHDEQLDRIVALKIPRAAKLSVAESEQFVREAQAAAQLRHPCIVSMFEVGREDDTIYLVTEYIAGITLSEYIGGQPIMPREATRMCSQIAHALHHAHEAGVIHRDLKPGNVLLDDNDIPHIADFGLARREAADTTVSMDGRVLGTPAYMSPEQAQGRSNTADRRSDVYAAGVMLFEMLTGEKPFRGNLQMLLNQVISEPAPRPSKLNSNVPRDLETICLKCLEKDPARRYQTARSFAEDLDAFLEGRPVKARPLGTFGQLTRWAKRKPVVAALSITVLLVSIAGVSGILWQLGNANTNLEEARVQWGRAERQTLAAKNAQQEAEAQRKEAENRFDFAVETVERFLTIVPNSELLHQPGMEPLKRDLHALSLEHYEKLATMRPLDIRTRKKLAGAHFFLAMTLEDIGDQEKAVTEYTAASKIFDELTATEPENPQHRQNLAACFGNLANVQINLGQRSEGIDTYRRICEMQKSILTEHPDDSVTAMHLAVTYLNLSALEIEDIQPDAGLESITRSIEIAEELLNSHADDAQLQLLFAKGSSIRAHFNWTKQDHPTAVAQFEKACDVFRTLVTAHSENLQFRHEFAGTLNDFALMLFELKNQEQSDARWMECLEHIRFAASNAPDVVAYRESLCSQLLNRGICRRNLGQFDSALTDLQESRELKKENADWLYATGMNLAQFALIIDANTDEFPDDVTARRDEFADHAIRWIDEAIDHGFTDVELLRTSDHLKAIRDRPAFQKLVARLTTETETPVPID